MRLNEKWLSFTLETFNWLITWQISCMNHKIYHKNVYFERERQSVSFTSARTQTPYSIFCYFHVNVSTLCPRWSNFSDGCLSGGLLRSPSAGAQLCNLLNKGSLALPAATLAGPLCCQGSERESVHKRDVCVDDEEEHRWQDSALTDRCWDADSILYFCVWKTYLHFKHALCLF